MKAFATALKLLMRDRNMAEEVVYTPSGGGALTIRASISVAERSVALGDGGFTGPQVTADVQVSDVPSPRSGDRLVRADGWTYVVVDHQADSLRLTHRLTLQEA